MVELNLNDILIFSEVGVFMLQDDLLTSGILTRAIQNSWSVASKGSSKYIDNKDLLGIHASLLAHREQVFQKTARYVYVPGNAILPDMDVEKRILVGINDLIDNNAKQREVPHVDYFQTPGFILDDGIYAAAYGKLTYIYRTKGTRAVWFENGDIIYFSVYSELDDRGFSISYEEIDSINIFNDEVENFRMYLYGQNAISEEGDVFYWLRQLGNISAPYEKAYYLEHLINPPEVHRISKYSVQLRSEIWKSVFQLIMSIVQNSQVQNGVDLLGYTMSELSFINLHPPTVDLVSFFEQIVQNRAENVKNSDLLNMLGDLRRNFTLYSQQGGEPNEEISSLQELIRNHQRRLRVLENKFALLGISADASLSIEIEDIKSRILSLQTTLNSKIENS